MHKFLAIVCVCFLAVCVFPTQAIYCWVGIKGDFNNRQPLVLKANSNEFLYPSKSNSSNLKLNFCETLRAVCPQSELTVFSSNVRKSEANLRCYGLTFFHMLDTSYVAPFKNIGCVDPPKATANMTGTMCPNGTIAQIGFPTSNSGYIPTIDQICHNVTRGETHWAHSRVMLAIRKKQSEQANRDYQIGNGFYPMIPMSSAVYTRDSERARLLTLIGDQMIVDMIIPPTGDNYLVEGMLVPKSDMFYRAQQDSTFFWINTVPMWKTIRDGNWKLVEDIVRKTAAKQSTDLDVWTGGYQVINLPSADNTTSNSTVEFTLTTRTDSSGNTTDAVPVPQHLFKYVVDRVRNRGIVFVTLNDPMGNTISADDMICQARSECSTLYPQFNVIPMGYTYCCTIDMSSQFYQVAQQLGLPTFPNAQPLI